MLACEIVWVKVVSDDGTSADGCGDDNKCWLPAQVIVVDCRSALASLPHSCADPPFAHPVAIQVYRHNSICRHERGRRLAGYVFVQLLSAAHRMMWIENDASSLLPFEDSTEQCWQPRQVSDVPRVEYRVCHLLATTLLLQDVVHGMQAAHRIKAAKAFYSGRD